MRGESLLAQRPKRTQLTFSVNIPQPSPFKTKKKKPFQLNVPSFCFLFVSIHPLDFRLLYLFFFSLMFSVGHIWVGILFLWSYANYAS